MNKNRNNGTWLMKIVWLAGLVLVIFGHNYLAQTILWRLSTPNNRLLLAWVQFLLPFVTGIYLSLIFLWSQFKARDASLFYLIALPTFILAIFAPLMVTFPIPLLPHPFIWLVEVLNQEGYLALVAGLTFLPSRR